MIGEWKFYEEDVDGNSVWEGDMKFLDNGVTKYRPMGV